MPVQRFIRSDPNLQEGCVRLVIVVRHPAFRRVPLQIPFSPVPVAPAVAPILLHYLVGELFPPLLVMLVNRFSLLSGEVAEVQPIPAGALGPAEVVKPVMLKGRVTSSVVDRRLRLPSVKSQGRWIIERATHSMASLLVRFQGWRDSGPPRDRRSGAKCGRALRGDH